MCANRKALDSSGHIYKELSPISLHTPLDLRITYTLLLLNVREHGDTMRNEHTQTESSNSHS